MKLSIITSALLLKSALAFAPVNTQQISNIKSSSSHGITLTPPSTSALQMAGFGGGGGMGGSKKKGKKEKKSKAVVLKPKAQWDRYVALKKSSIFRAAVRVVKEGTDAGEWYEIGKIKSEGDESTELALMLQRRLIAEHAKRLYPLQFRAKDQVEWGFTAEAAPEQGDWTLGNKSAAVDAPAGIEKKIGFEGKPDAGTGFYCHFKDGRLVDRYDEGKSLSK